MGIHQIFAQNLRDKCNQFETIASVCLQTGINRQQFNKYLAGSMLPNARTLNRLCTVFGIADWELFIPAEKVQTPLKPDGLPKADVIGQFGVEDMFCHMSDAIEGLNVSPSIEPGYYNCFFPLQSFPEFVVCSTIAVSQYGKRRKFVRHTRIASVNSPKRVLAFGKHRGIILSNGQSDYLLGVNSKMPTNISIMNFPRIGADINVGIALIHGINQPFVCRVALQLLPFGKSEIRKALSRAAIAPIGFNGIDPFVFQALGAHPQDIAGQISLIDMDSMLIS